MRQTRERENLSQEQLAAKLQLAGLNITQKAVSRMETGKRVIADYELPYLADVLDCYNILSFRYGRDPACR